MHTSTFQNPKFSATTGRRTTTPSVREVFLSLGWRDRAAWALAAFLALPLAVLLSPIFLLLKVHAYFHEEKRECRSAHLVRTQGEA